MNYGTNGRYDNALIRVFNEKYDLTYCYSLYREKDHGAIMEHAQNICQRWMCDKFGATLEEVKDVKTELLFRYVHDAILHNNYFQKENELKECADENAKIIKIDTKEYSYDELLEAIEKASQYDDLCR